MSDVKLIILRGYPGSGKTTIGKMLESRGVGIFIDHNAILTFIAGIAGNDGGIYDDIAALEQSITRKLLRENKAVIVARGFSSKSSIDSYVASADSMNVNCTVIRLQVEQDELIKRVQSPERKLDFNPTVDEAHIRAWIESNPIESYDNEIKINNNKPLEQVVSELISIL